jgi:short-subunit dehydrogenase
MDPKLKRLDDQVMVITGASSGIGFATAERAASQGASLVLAARSAEALANLVGRIEAAGGKAVAATCDVADRAQVEQVARIALDRFGRIDTWVNNAGVSIYGRLEEVSEEDNRRLFDTNFWGVVNGSLAALPHLRASGGALINVGSEVSEAVIPLQGMYSASKHAVKGFTDALRVEVAEVDGAPVSITLIQPTAVDTPYPQHARNYMAHEPKLPSPMLAPQQVVHAILEAATHPVRAKRVGVMSKINTTLFKLVPAMASRMSAKQFDRQHYDEPPCDTGGALFKPSEETSVVSRATGTGGIVANE